MLHCRYTNTQFFHPFEAYLTAKEKFGRYPLFAICLGAQHKEWETFQHIGFMHVLLLMKYRSSQQHGVSNDQNKTMAAMLGKNLICIRTKNSLYFGILLSKKQIKY